MSIYYFSFKVQLTIIMSENVVFKSFFEVNETNESSTL